MDEQKIIENLLSFLERVPTTGTGEAGSLLVCKGWLQEQKMKVVNVGNGKEEEPAKK